MKNTVQLCAKEKEERYCVTLRSNLTIAVPQVSYSSTYRSSMVPRQNQVSLADLALSPIL